MSERFLVGESYNEQQHAQEGLVISSNALAQAARTGVDVKQAIKALGIIATAGNTTYHECYVHNQRGGTQ